MKVIPYGNVAGSNVVTLSSGTPEGVLVIRPHSDVDGQELVLVSSYDAAGEYKHRFDDALAHTVITALKTAGDPVELHKAGAGMVANVLSPEGYLRYDPPKIPASSEVEITLEVEGSPLNSTDYCAVLLGEGSKEVDTRWARAVGSQTVALNSASQSVDLEITATRDFDGAFLVMEATPLVRDGTDVVSPYPVISSFLGAGNNLNRGQGASKVPVCLFSPRSGAVGLDITQMQPGSATEMRLEMSSPLAGGSTTTWLVTGTLLAADGGE